MNLSFSSKGLDEERLAICDKINELYPSKMAKRKSWEWRTNWTTKRVDVPDDFDEEWLSGKLDAMLVKLKSFEKELAERMGVAI